MTNRTNPFSLVIIFLVLSIPLFFLPQSYEPFIFPKNTLLQMVLVWSVCGFLVFAERAPFRRSSFPVFVLLAAISLSFMFSRFKAAETDAFFVDVSLLITCLVCLAGVRSAKDLAKITAVTVFTAGLVAVIGMFQGVAAVTTLGNPSFTGSYLAVVLPLSLSLLCRSKAGNSRLLWGVITIVIFICLVLTGSRSGWMAALGGVLLWFVLCRKHINGENRRKIIYVFATLMILGGFLLFFSRARTNFTIGRLVSAFDFRSEAVRNRLLMWRVAGEMVKDRPVLGIGPGGYHYRHLDYQAKILNKPVSASWVRNWTYTHSPHNDFLHIMAEWGILGTGCFVLLLAVFARQSQQVWLSLQSDDRNLLGGWICSLVAFLINGLFMFPLHLPANVLLFSVAVASPGAFKEETGTTSVFPGIRRIATHPVFKSASSLILIFVCVYLTVSVCRRQISELYVGRGMFWVTRNNLLQAREYFHKAVAQKPHNGMAHFFLGNTEIFLGNYNHAVEHLKRGLNLISDPNVPYDLGLAYMNKGDLRQARDNFLHAIYWKPSFPEALASLGDLSFREGKPDEAKKYFDTAVSVGSDPEFALHVKQFLKDERVTELQRGNGAYQGIYKKASTSPPVMETRQ